MDSVEESLDPDFAKKKSMHVPPEQLNTTYKTGNTSLERYFNKVKRGNELLRAFNFGTNEEQWKAYDIIFNMKEDPKGYLESVTSPNHTNSLTDFIVYNVKTEASKDPPKKEDPVYEISDEDSQNDNPGRKSSEEEVEEELTDEETNENEEVYKVSDEEPDRKGLNQRQPSETAPGRPKDLPEANEEVYRVSDEEEPNNPSVKYDPTHDRKDNLKPSKTTSPLIVKLSESLLALSKNLTVLLDGIQRPKQPPVFVPNETKIAPLRRFLNVSDEQYIELIAPALLQAYTEYLNTLPGEKKYVFAEERGGYTNDKLF